MMLWPNYQLALKYMVWPQKVVWIVEQKSCVYAVRDTKMEGGKWSKWVMIPQGCLMN